MKNNNINEILEKVSELYREEMKEAKKILAIYNETLDEMNSNDVSYKRYKELENRARILKEDYNNLKSSAEGISKTRESLFDFL